MPDASVTQNVLPLLGVRPTVGRLFTPEEDRPGTAPVALISYSLWQRRFSANPGVLGQALVLNGRNVTVIGVLPRDFYVPWQYVDTARPDIVTPLATDFNKWDRGDHEFAVIGRLKGRGRDPLARRTGLERAPFRAACANVANLLLGARRRAAEGDCGALRVGRGPLPDHAPVADRERSAGGGRGRDRYPAGGGRRRMAQSDGELATGSAELNEFLKESGRSASHGRHGNRLRNILVVSKIALARTRLMGAGLMVRSLMRLLDVNPSFRSDHVQTAQVNLSDSRHSSGARRVGLL